MDRGRLVAELPMQSFKNGIKRDCASPTPLPLPGDTPFVVLAREGGNGGSETWTVRGWQAPMSQYFGRRRRVAAKVIDLDLEEGFVELLRTFREPRD